jgi:hypothetical protein
MTSWAEQGAPPDVEPLFHILLPIPKIVECTEQLGSPEAWSPGKFSVERYFMYFRHVL